MVRLSDRHRLCGDPCLPAGIALGPGAGRFSGGPGNRMAHPVSQPALPAAHGDGPSLVHPDAGADRREVGVRGQVLEAGLQPLPGLRAADLALPHVPRPRPAGVCQGGGLGAVAVRLGADADRLPGGRRVAWGATGLFGWWRKLPWQHPATTAASLAVVNMMFGIALAFVLIQEKMAPLLSDTFFVPGYFHFFTVGTVSLSLLAGLTVLLPELTGRELRWPGLLRSLPWVASTGLLVFGSAGVAAGYMGVPRRVMDG